MVTVVNRASFIKKSKPFTSSFRFFWTFCITDSRKLDRINYNVRLYLDLNLTGKVSKVEIIINLTFKIAAVFVNRAWSVFWALASDPSVRFGVSTILARWMCDISSTFNFTVLLYLFYRSLTKWMQRLKFLSSINFRF